MINGQSRATLWGDVVTFGAVPGAFTVIAQCKEHPAITSLRNTAPYNFETNNGPFARTAHVVDQPAAAGLSAPQRLLIGVAAATLGVLLGLLIADNVGSGSGSGSCTVATPCVCSFGGANCTSKGSSYCSSLEGFSVSCVSEYPMCTCDSNGNVSSARVRNVQQLVAQGLHRSGMIDESELPRSVESVTVRPRDLACAPATRDVRGTVATSTSLRPLSPMTATTTSSLAPLGSVLAAALVSLAGMAIVHDPHFELRVWLAPDTGGVVVGGRF